MQLFYNNVVNLHVKLLSSVICKILMLAIFFLHLVCYFAASSGHNSRFVKLLRNNFALGSLSKFWELIEYVMYFLIFQISFPLPKKFIDERKGTEKRNQE